MTARTVDLLLALLLLAAVALEITNRKDRTK